MDSPLYAPSNQPIYMNSVCQNNVLNNTIILNKSVDTIPLVHSFSCRFYAYEYECIRQPCVGTSFLDPLVSIGQMVNLLNTCSTNGM